ncbi:MAG: hypothetical protein ABJQ23_02140 [Shimia thalassica]|uniref:hypothetical protein n=1 Tax=Shimia thalassica TaxID=1715693 RepID=UPI0032972CF2
MSDTDSFIEEVTEEVRRDRMFTYMRRYGWIAVTFVVVLVGGAAVNEYFKATALSDAQANGDSVVAALSKNDVSERIAALEALQANPAEAQTVVDLLLATEQLSTGDRAASAATLEGISASSVEQPAIYNQIALFKSVLARGAEASVEERRALLAPLASPGAPLALLAQEQLALLDLEEGNAEAAMVKLQSINADASVTAGLRQRTSRLIVALGGDLPELAAPAVSQ